jgi:D-arabinose 1-dehydrogenase-like Zn-dependent alcohol dehydrogenase
MGFSDEPLIVTYEIIGNRSRIIGSQQNDHEYLYEALDYVAKGSIQNDRDLYEVLDYVAKGRRNPKTRQFQTKALVIRKFTN